MEFEYLVDGAPHKIAVENRGGKYLVRDGERSFEAEIQAVSDQEIFVLAGGRGRRIFIARDGLRTLIHSGGRFFEIREPGRGGEGFSKEDDGGPDGGGVVKAPMPGKVIKIFVTEGETVRRNQALLIVEAMKMENEIKSSLEGSVKKIHVSAGELVDPEKVLLELEAK